MSDRITDIIIGDHVELMTENRRLQEEIERLAIDLKMAQSMYDVTVKERDYERTVVERLRAQLARVEKMGWFCPDSAEYPNAKCDRAEKAEAEVERLRADAERYRWLRGEVHGPHVPLAQVVWKFNNIRDNFRWINLSDGQTLDEHIDAARGEL